MKNQEGWADSIITRSSTKTHYYLNGVSLCKRSRVDNGMYHFDKDPDNIASVYSCHCALCIKLKPK